MVCEGRPAEKQRIDDEPRREDTQADERCPQRWSRIAEPPKEDVSMRHGRDDCRGADRRVPAPVSAVRGRMDTSSSAPKYRKNPFSEIAENDSAHALDGQRP